tara:strand:+ start:165 stop:2159 length:1995 start_codon:yes stop_codon:yes gene_type:complete
MDPITRQAIAVAGGAGAGDATYVEDVFSTFLFDGNSSTQTINNGIDLDGEGGLVWFATRSGTATGSVLQDTDRGGTKFNRAHSSSQEETSSSMITSFNSNGFTISNDTNVNYTGDKKVAWTFRKTPGFFDIVQYTGDGTTSRNIAHNLGSVPGMILVKRLNDSDDWQVYHRSLGATKCLQLNHDYAASTITNRWYDTEPTSTVFTVANTSTNANGKTYIAYVFAHDDQSFGTNSDEAIIKCGSYTGTGTSGNDVNVGFEPQWLFIKQTNTTRHWMMIDYMRGTNSGDPSGATGTAYIIPNRGDLAELNGAGNIVDPKTTGFELKNHASLVNESSGSYIYMAIRRPHKPPTAGTEVFGISSHFTGNNSGTRAITTGGVTLDLVLTKMTTHGSTSNATCWTDRLRGGQSLGLSSNQSDANSYWTALSGWHAFDVMDGYKIGGTYYVYSNSSSSKYISYGIKRAPGFFDIVQYVGNGSARTIAHGLGATPSVVLIKGTDTVFNWYWQHYALGANTFLQLNNDEIQGGNGDLFNNTLPTSSVFSLGDLGGGNQNTKKYVAYLFGDVDGISKAGTYSGTGYDINVDCGFSAGARFVIIKRANAAGDWYLYDSVRGIVSGNDPYSLLNTTAQQVTNTDYIDPLNAGFTVTSSAPAALNTSGGTYLFLAIA